MAHTEITKIVKSLIAVQISVLLFAKASVTWRTHSCVPCSHSCEHKAAKEERRSRHEDRARQREPLSCRERDVEALLRRADAALKSLLSTHSAASGIDEYRKRIAQRSSGLQLKSAGLAAGRQAEVDLCQTLD